MTRWLFVLAMTIAPLSATAQTSQDEPKQIVLVVQRFFDTMASADPAEAAKLLLPEGRFFRVREEAGKPPQISTFTNREYLETLKAPKEKVLERMWDPQVNVHGRIATLWTRYDFYRNGAFSHCGIDAFDLVKDADGWKISGGVYTVEATSCPPSPLGPPKP